MRERNLGREGVFHIGDNYKADYDVPRSFGITSYHLPSLVNCLFNKHCSKGQWNFVFGNKFKGLDPLLKIVLGYTINSNEYEIFDTLKSGQIYTNIRQLGLVFISTILNGTILEILNNQTIQKNYQCIYFSSRDGFLPQKIYEVFQSKCSDKALPSEYFYAGSKIYNSCKQTDFIEFITSVQSQYTIGKFINRYMNK